MVWTWCTRTHEITQLPQMSAGFDLFKAKEEFLSALLDRIVCTSTSKCAVSKRDQSFTWRFLCRKCLHQWMFGLGVAMIFGPRVTCKVSSTSPSQWNPRCMSSWLIISTLRLWLRPSGGCFEDNVSIKTATLPRICICHCLRVARSPKMWAAILFGKDFPPILNTRESPFLTRSFRWLNHQDPRRSHWLCHLDPAAAETAYGGGFSFTHSWLQKTK